MRNKKNRPLYSRVRVAIKFESVPSRFAMITVPIFTGPFISTLEISSTAWKTSFLGIGLSVFTGSLGRWAL